MIQYRYKTAAIFFLLTALTACQDSSNTGIATDSHDIKDRRALMRDWRRAMDDLKSTQDNPTNFDAAAVQEKTQFLQQSTAQMWSYFQDSTQPGNTSETAWSDPAAFKVASDNFDAATSALHTAATHAQSPADFSDALGKVQESCGSCHKVFRQR